MQKIQVQSPDFMPSQRQCQISCHTEVYNLCVCVCVSLFKYTATRICLLMSFVVLEKFSANFHSNISFTQSFFFLLNFWNSSYKYVRHFHCILSIIYIYIWSFLLCLVCIFLVTHFCLLTYSSAVFNQYQIFITFYFHW